jgi:hypothetical protein
MIQDKPSHSWNLNAGRELVVKQLREARIIV